MRWLWGGLLGGLAVGLLIHVADLLWPHPVVAAVAWVILCIAAAACLGAMVVTVWRLRYFLRRNLSLIFMFVGIGPVCTFILPRVLHDANLATPSPLIDWGAAAFPWVGVCLVVVSGLALVLQMFAEGPTAFVDWNDDAVPPASAIREQRL